MHTTENLARYYADETYYEYHDADGYGLVTLCLTCARETGLQHAETPPSWEELECSRCGIMNEQGALWVREMSDLSAYFGPERERG